MMELVQRGSSLLGMCSKWIFAFGCLCLIGCQSVGETSQQKHWDSYAKNDGRTFTGGNGLLVLGLNPVEMTNKMSLTNKGARVLSYTLKNVQTGEIFSLEHTYGRLNVTSVPAGRYCIDRIVTYTNVRLSHCATPFLDVEANEIENAGVFTLGIHYSGKGSVTHNFFKGFRKKGDITKRLSDVQKQALKAFVDSNPSKVIVREFSSALNKIFKVRLFPDGTAELKKVGDSKPTYEQGNWEVNDGLYQAVFRKTHAYVFSADDHIAPQMRTLPAENREPWEFTQYRLSLVDNSVANEYVNSLSEGIKWAVAPGIGYPEAPFKAGKTGNLEIEFSFVPKSGWSYFKPGNIKVLESFIDEEQLAGILKRVSYHLFSVPESFNLQSQIYTAEIVFEIVKGYPQVNIRNIKPKM